MEQKLREFKSRRRREIAFNKPKEFIQAIMQKVFGERQSAPDNSEIANRLLPEKEFTINSKVPDDEVSTLSMSSSSEDTLTFSQSSTSWLTFFTYILYFTLWVIIYLIAIHLEFGYVYLTLSGLVFIYFNTRTGPKKEGEISAYSVFNPGCHAIEGSLKAEQFEREFNLIQH